MDLSQRKKCCALMKKELRWKNLWFDEKNPAKFATTAWLHSQFPFLVYRIVSFIYAGSIFGWSSYKASHLPTDQDITAWFLSFSVWSFMLFTIYKTLSLMLTALNFDLDCLCNDDLSWYHKVCWILHVVAFNSATSCMIGTIIYHIAVEAHDTAVITCMEIFNSDDINFYAISALVMSTDVLIHSIPIRLLHFIYPSVFFAVYVLIHVYRYAAGLMSTHDVFSFRTLPVSSTTFFFILTAVLFIPIIHLWAYGIDILRKKIILKIRSRNKHEILHAVNSSFSQNTPERTTLRTDDSVLYQTSVFRNGSESTGDQRIVTIRESTKEDGTSNGDLRHH